MSTAGISNYIYVKLWDVITNPYLNFNGTTIDIKAWICTFYLHITYACPNLHTMLVKGALACVVLLEFCYFAHWQWNVSLEEQLHFSWSGLFLLCPFWLHMILSMLWFCTNSVFLVTMPTLFVTDGIRACHYDNIWCCLWWHCNDYHFSVLDRYHWVV